MFLLVFKECVKLHRQTIFGSIRDILLTIYTGQTAMKYFLSLHLQPIGFDSGAGSSAGVFAAF